MKSAEKTEDGADGDLGVMPSAGPLHPRVFVEGSVDTGSFTTAFVKLMELSPELAKAFLWESVTGRVELPEYEAWDLLGVVLNELKTRFMEFRLRSRKMRKAARKRSMKKRRRTLKRTEKLLGS